MNFCPACQHSNTVDAAFCSACGARMELSASDEAFVAESLPFPVGAEVAFGRYTLEAVLGQGGMGTVYRARDESLGRRCALKVLTADLLAHPTARKRMEREARALARIDHRNVVRVSNIFVEGDLLVMELEYMEGGDLQGQVGPNGMAHERAVALMAGILAGLQALHDAQLVHRDIKPENVLLTGDGAPKLTDLGIARDDADKTRTRTRLGAVLGTLEYMSPEQIQGWPVDARSDIYACGNLLYHLLTGGLPYSATSDFEWQVAHVQQPPDLAGLRRNAPELATVVERALEKLPDARWQSAADMATALRGATREESDSVLAPSHAVGTNAPIQPSLSAEAVFSPSRRPPNGPQVRGFFAKSPPSSGAPAASRPAGKANGKNKINRFAGLLAACILVLGGVGTWLLIAGDSNADVSTKNEATNTAAVKARAANAAAKARAASAAAAQARDDALFDRKHGDGAAEKDRKRGQAQTAIENAIYAKAEAAEEAKLKRRAAVVPKPAVVKSKPAVVRPKVKPTSGLTWE